MPGARHGAVWRYVATAVLATTTLHDALSPSGPDPACFPAAHALLPRADSNQTLPVLLDSYNLLYLDNRIRRPEVCITDESRVDTTPALLEGVLRCWRDACLCRGGLWVESEQGCSHLCNGVTCEKMTCHAPGECNPLTGKCGYSPLPDGEPCEADPGVARLAEEVSPDPQFRCYFGKCLHNTACSGRQCRLPASECYAVSCGPSTPLPGPPGSTSTPATVAPVSNVTSPPPPLGCIYHKVNGTLCSSGQGICLQGVCKVLPDEALREEKARLGLEVRDLCDGVECQPFYHPCRASGGCVNGSCVEVFHPNGTGCDDMMTETVGDRCLGGSCTGEARCVDASGGVVVCTTENPECSVPECRNNGGGCFDIDKPDGTPCSDGNPDTTYDFCLAGRCVGSTAFYDCSNHELCYGPLLHCLRPFTPSCPQVYDAQCEVLSAVQRCSAGASVCRAGGVGGVSPSLLMAAAAVAASILMAG